MVFILPIILILIISGCGKQNANHSTDSIQRSENEIINKEETNVHNLPEIVNLMFEPLELIELKEKEQKESWQKIKTIPLGNVQGQNVTLHVYKETNDNNNCGLGYETVSQIEFAGRMYNLNDECTSTGLLNDDPEKIGAVFPLQYSYENLTNQQILLSGIELTANGPGKLIYIIFDGISKKWFSFESWGSPLKIDLDNNGDMEMVVQFPGLHMSWPDVTIYRWNNGRLEGSSSIKNALGISNYIQNQLVFQIKEDQAIFEGTVLTDKEKEQFETIKYRYENGTLLMIN